MDNGKMLPDIRNANINIWRKLQVSTVIKVSIITKEKYILSNIGFE